MQTCTNKDGSIVKKTPTPMPGTQPAADLFWQPPDGGKAASFKDILAQLAALSNASDGNSEWEPRVIKLEKSLAGLL